MMSLISSDMASMCSKNSLGIPESVPTGASLLLLFSSLASENDAFITNISVIQSWRWFFGLTPFESVFLVLIMMQILTLQLLGILPINVNQLVNGMSSGRKKRDASICKQKSTNLELSGHILNILHRVDKDGCIFRTLCEAQKHTNFGVKMPRSLLLMLFTLSSSNICAKLALSSMDESNLIPKLLPLYQEAVNLGQEASYSKNSTECERKYSVCPLGVEEIMSYIQQIRLDDML